MDVKEKVTSLVLEKCKLDKINDDDNLISLGLDSLDIVEIMLDVEDEFSIEFTNDELIDLKTFKDVLTLIEKKLK